MAGSRAIASSVADHPRLLAVLIADGGDFITRPVAQVEFGFAGIAGDRHAGATRGADARTPWHPRRAAIANTRQLSIVSAEECGEIAAALGVPTVDPGWLGANLLVAGIPRLSRLPAASRLQFPSGATVYVTDANAPCAIPARALAEAFERPALASGFVPAARGRRGLVGMVERPGSVAAGDPVRLLPPPRG